jgi:predicted nucleic acid-binding protein
MIILDTNVVSEAMKAQTDPAVLIWLDKQGTSDLYLTATSLAELRLGIEILPVGRRKAFLAGTLERILRQVIGNRVMPFDADAARMYAEIVTLARARGLAIGIADGQIAAVAAVHGFTVATRDTSPFEAAGVAFVNPWEL